MKERPILFSAPMVRAILSGTKTQTRRVITGQGPDFHARAAFHGMHNGVAVFGDSIPDDPVPVEVRCPYGQPGDRLWVRETWCLAGPNTWDAPKVIGPGPHRDTAYFAADWVRSPPSRWRPSIHMPRWASRLLLEVTEVRVHRLQDISEEDAKAEGVDLFEAKVGSYRDAFQLLWDSINGGRPWCCWDDNPWVWAVSFRVHSSTGRA